MRSLLAVHDAISLRPGKVLEVAAGGCGLTATLAARGVEVCANDIRIECLTQALKDYKTANSIKIIGGNLFDLSVEQSGTFDLVIACEVIEHVAHPTELLKHLKTFLRPDGHLLLTTPNGAYFRNRLPTFSQVKDFDQLELVQFKPDADGHLFLFTPSELCEVARAEGFSVESLNVWGTPLLTGHALFRLFSAKLFTKVAHEVEELSQQFPMPARQYFCFAMSSLLRNS